MNIHLWIWVIVGEDRSKDIIKERSRAFKEGWISREEDEKWKNFIKKFLARGALLMILEKEDEESKRRFKELSAELVAMREDIEKIKRKSMSGFLDGVPRNENGVMFAFGRLYECLKPELAKLIGEGSFDKLEFKTEYPDAEAVKGDKRLRIEFEYTSSEFKRHFHDEKKCDLIVCWMHDWRECPIKVLELSELTIYERGKELAFF